MRTLSSAPLLFALGVIAGSACQCSDEPPTTQCMTDAECREGERCTPEGACVVGIECVTDEECTETDARQLCNLDAPVEEGDPEQFTCIFREGFGDDCAADRPCPFGEFCSELHGKCYVSANARDCVRRAQCPSGQICDRNANKCVPDLGCYGDQFCEDGEFCDTVNRTCRAANIECVSCVVDGTCPGSELCLVSTRECVIDLSAQTCNEGETCDPLGRCVQCRSSEECGPGLFCNVALGRCESNVQCVNDPSECPSTAEVTCVECVEPEICDARTRRCQAPALACDSDVECPGDQFCDMTLDPPICVNRIPECLDDLIDEDGSNDTIAEAAKLEEGMGPLFDELRVCPGNQDWYQIAVAAGTYLTIDARFEHDVGDVELQLFLEDGRSLLDESRSTTDNERVELEVGTDLVVYLRVFLGTPTIRSVPYQLIVAHDPGSLCEDDEAEPSDSRDMARQLVNDIPFEGRLCTGDPDWFVLRQVEAASRVQVDLSFVDSLGNLDLELYRSNATVPTRVEASTTDNERIVFDAPYGGDFFLRVVGHGPDTNVYTIRAQVRPGEGVACLDDPWEPNDVPTTATPTSALGPLPITDPTICGGDKDWYAIPLAFGESLRAEMTFDPSADLDMKLYAPGTVDVNSSPIDQSIGFTGREHIGFRNFLEEGDYLLRVYGTSPQSIAKYELELEVKPLGVCQPDAVELQGRGNSAADPFPLGLPPVEAYDLTFCDPDTDFYQVFLQGGFVNVLRLSFFPDDAILEMELRLPGSNPMDPPLFTSFPAAGQAPSEIGYREVFINVPGQGFAVVNMQVLRSTATGSSDYNITLDLQPMFPCMPDAGEPNNRAATPSLIASSSVAPVMIEDLTMCTSFRDGTNTGDEDWYLLNPPEAGAIIDARIEHDQGDMLLELFSPGAVRRACVNFGADRCFSDGNGLSERVTFTATTTAPYLLRASSVWSSPNAGVRPADADTPYDLSVTYTLP
ncbi:MAG: hypothetical protein RMA76_28790 [Deltaproteobacteria bacterium]|jgi:hypothetical protein